MNEQTNKQTIEQNYDPLMPHPHFSFLNKIIANPKEFGKLMHLEEEEKEIYN